MGGEQAVTTPKELAEEEALALEFYLMGLASGSAVLDPDLLKQAATLLRTNGGAKRELAEEFRRLAAELAEEYDSMTDNGNGPTLDACLVSGKATAFWQAAQMVEDKLG